MKATHSNKHIAWLQQEIQNWLAEGIITSTQAQQLAQRYPIASQPNAWGKIVFSAIGALLIGLGVILFFAYNWDAMHRLLKLALVLGAIAITHLVGWYLSFYKSPYQRLGESLHLLGTLLYGAGIWLIAQVYHIDEHYPNGILLWSLGAFAMAWALNSSIQALLAMALIGFWCGIEVFDFDRDMAWAPWAIGFIAIPFAWRKNSPLLMFFASVLFCMLLLFTAVNNDIELIIHLLFVLSLSFMGAAKLVPRFNRAELSNVMFGVGTIVYFILLFSLTFVEFVDDLFLDKVDLTVFTIYLLLPFLLVTVIGILLWRERDTLLPSNPDRIDMALKYAVILVFLVSTLLIDSAIPVIFFNIVLFAHSILYLLSGMEHLRWQRVAFGSFMLALLVFVRFLDLFDSLLLRSLAFILLGIGLFVVGIVFSRQKEKEQIRHG